MPFTPRLLFLPCAVLVLLTGCGSDQSALPEQTAEQTFYTVDLSTAPTTPALDATSTAAASATTEIPATTAAAPTTATPVPDPETTAVPEPPTSPSPSPAAAAFDPATLPDAPAPDPETPGADTGPQCAIDPSYLDEDPAGIEANALTAWRAAEVAANAQGQILCLNDGKRSRAQQQATYDDYVVQYGQAAADLYVLPPEKSAHVTGYAIDVQPASAYNWLQATNGAFGFCRTYDIEPWHFEFNRSFAADGCPARLPAPVR